MRTAELERLAHEVGAKDLFLFELVAPSRLVNIDGYGRGAGWAGNIEVQPETEPWLAEAMEMGVARLARGVPSRAFGPYWASEASAVWTGDHLVVFGGKGTASLVEDRLVAAAGRAAAVTEGTPVAKRLADDLEVAQAELAVARLTGGTVESIAEGVAAAAAEALGCEFGAVFLFGPPPRVYLVDRGWRPAATEDEIAAALTPIAHASGTTLQVEQDLDQSPFALPPLSFPDGLVSRCTCGLGPSGTLGVVSMCHAGDRPRGFTSLCQRIMVAVGSAAEIAFEAAAKSGTLERA